MTDPAGDPIRISLAVRADPARAFSTFTEAIGSWWPLAEYSRTYNELRTEGVTAVRLDLEPRRGGRLIERSSDGRVLPWGEVEDWDPPHRVVLAWHPHDLPEAPTVVAVTFEAGDGGTIVQLDHSGWEALSAAFRNELYDVYAQGWPATLRLYADAAEA